MGRRILPWSIRPTLHRQYGTNRARPPIIRINNGTFYRHHPSSHSTGTIKNTPLFKDLNFELASFSQEPQYWAITGLSSTGKTTFLQVLRGKHLSIPPTARSYPYLESEEIEKKDHSLRNVEKAIQYVGFDGEQKGSNAPQTAYMSARYESRREETDWSVSDYLLGNMELNPSQDIGGKKVVPETLARVIKDLRLDELAEMPVSNLSNGQTRRARIAKALLGNPEVLLLDEPFMGLDPPTLLSLSPMLERLAKTSAPRLVLSLRPQDPIPDWITHLVYLSWNCEVAFQGPKDTVLNDMRSHMKLVKEGSTAPVNYLPHSMLEFGRTLTKDGIIEPGDGECTGKPATNVTTTTTQPGKSTPLQNQVEETLSRDGYRFHDNRSQLSANSEALVEMEGAVVRYGSKTVLGNWKQNVNDTEKVGLWWTIRRGERWGIFGPNGSGKTTILSLICSDHPQTYSLPIKIFGRPRIPEPGQRGVSIFDIRSRIGHSSPEIHNHIPRSLTLRQVLENAWSDTFRGIPRLDQSAHKRIDACLRWFEEDLWQGKVHEQDSILQMEKKPSWADTIYFGGMPFSAQRVALFLRAIIKHPDLVILDESFSGMDDVVRDRCLLFLAHGEKKELRHSDHNGNLYKQPKVEESLISKMGLDTVTGLTEHQALLCISHVREEIPGSIREWICLPEANTGEAARFGKLDGPIEGDYRRWNEIWGM